MLRAKYERRQFLGIMQFPMSDMSARSPIKVVRGE